MLDFTTPIGQVIERRLQQEQIIWLTTVDAQGTPQPRPVWFHWDGETLLIFSQPGAAKIRHISRNPRVALNFNTSADGGAVGVLTRRNLFIILFSIELMMNAVNINLVGFSGFHQDMTGQNFVLFTMAVAAAEAAVGLAIATSLFRNRQTLMVDLFDTMKG